MFFLTI